jgi:hypothetical protein
MTNNKKTKEIQPKTTVYHTSLCCPRAFQVHNVDDTKKHVRPFALAAAKSPIFNLEPIST